MQHEASEIQIITTTHVNWCACGRQLSTHYGRKVGKHLGITAADFRKPPRLLPLADKGLAGTVGGACGGSTAATWTCPQSCALGRRPRPRLRTNVSMANPLGLLGLTTCRSRNLCTLLLQQADQPKRKIFRFGVWSQQPLLLLASGTYQTPGRVRTRK